MAKILIVDDEKNIVEIIKFNLEKEGFETIEAYDGLDAYNLALSQKPDLILLDIMLPGMDGFSVCKNLRNKISTPIIMISAKEEEGDKILGLELGADDYMTKPFSPRELMARVRSNLRRVNIEDNKNSGKEIISGDVIIDVDKYEISICKKPIQLTVREYELVKFLVEHKGQVFTREQLLEKVWGYEYYGGSTVDVTIRRIREKIDKVEEKGGAKYIITKRGVGYYFDA